jgi:hypothetical protein
MIRTHSLPHERWGENRPPKGKGGPRFGSVDKGWWVTIASAKSARNAGSTGFLLSGVTLSRFSAPAFFLARRGQRSGISRQGRSFGGGSVHLLMEALISFLLTAGEEI